MSFNEETVKQDSAKSNHLPFIKLWMEENVKDYYNVENLNNFIKNRRTSFIDMLISKASPSVVLECSAFDKVALLHAITKYFIKEGILEKGDEVSIEAVEQSISHHTFCLLNDRDGTGYTDIFGNHHSSIWKYLVEPKTLRELLIGYVNDDSV